MLSLVSATAIAGLVLNDICRKDTDCAKGETCTFPPRIARACVERDEFSRWERCTDELAHCCPKGTACKGSSWWKSCRPLVGKCEKPEICCLAIPQCKDGFKEVKEGVCTKEDFALGECVEESLCCTTITCKKEKKGCKLSCGTEVADGWSGMGEGSNHCNQCGCNNGLLRCTKMACMKRPCPGEGKSCKLSCGTVVADGWKGNDEGANHCNTCSCRDGLLGCTEMECLEKKECPCNEFTKESPCIALEGVCYNAGQCTCGFFSQVKCKAAPCSVNSCPKGYTCRNNYCGGCNFQCVKEE